MYAIDEINNTIEEAAKPKKDKRYTKQRYSDTIEDHYWY